MAKKIIKDNQKYHSLEAYILLGLFSSMLLFELIQSAVLTHTKDLSHWTIFSVLVLVFALTWYIVLKAKLKIRVTKSTLSIQRTPFFGKQYKLPFKDMEAVSFITVSQAAKTSGWAINMCTNCKEFDFGDNNGVHVLMNNGEEYLIFSDLLYDRRNQLEKIIEMHRVGK